MRRREFKTLHARKIRVDHVSNKLLRATSTETPRPAHVHLALQRDAPPRKASIHRRDTLHHLAVYKLKNENGAQSNDPSRNDTLTGDTGAGRDLPKGQSTLKKAKNYYTIRRNIKDFSRKSLWTVDGGNLRGILSLRVEIRARSRGKSRREQPSVPLYRKDETMPPTAHRASAICKYALEAIMPFCRNKRGAAARNASFNRYVLRLLLRARGGLSRLL